MDLTWVWQHLQVGSQVGSDLLVLLDPPPATLQRHIHTVIALSPRIAKNRGQNACLSVFRHYNFLTSVHSPTRNSHRLLHTVNDKSLQQGSTPELFVGDDTRSRCTF